MQQWVKDSGATPRQNPRSYKAAAWDYRWIPEKY
jgi:hypothetical protein